jgi:Holliday junction resolvase RusA-like endonuclease
MLSWPPQELMPNRANGRAWQTSYATREAYRLESYLKTRQAMTTQHYEPPKGRDGAVMTWQIMFTFHPPDARRRDLDNLHAAMKPAIDGMAQALGVDDALFVRHAQQWGERLDEGFVVVTLQEISFGDEGRR